MGVANKLKVSPITSIREAIPKLVDGNKKTLFVVNESQQLLGLFTNGDMRRFLLSSQNMTQPVSTAMNPHPVTFKTYAEAKDANRAGKFIVCPIVDDDNILIGAVYKDEIECANKDIISNELMNIPLVIMAGGKGTRLYPYTKILPKALVPIGDITITERIINTFHRYGCNKIFMVLNHKANMIKAYFNDLSKDYIIDYVQEDKFYGTAGGLYLLRDKLNSTFILSNCDIIINDDIACAYKTHVKQQNMLTIICSMKDFTIPYGIVNTNKKGIVTSINEKPELDYLVNTGVYIIEPVFLDLLRDGEFAHITTLIKRCIECGHKVGVFPISGSAWLDMGQLDNMEEMLSKFNISNE